MKKIRPEGWIGIALIVVIGAITFLAYRYAPIRYNRVGKRVEYRETVRDDDSMKVTRTTEYKLSRIHYDTVTKRTNHPTSTLDVAPRKSTVIKEPCCYGDLQIVDLNDVLFEPSDSYIDWNHCCLGDVEDSILRAKGIYYHVGLDAWVKNVR